MFVGWRLQSAAIPANSLRRGMATTQCRHTRERSEAGMAKLVDALDLGSSGATRGSSNLPTRTRLLPTLC